MSYYTSDAFDDPTPGSRFSVGFEHPPKRREDEGRGVVEYDPGPRMRIVLEGERAFMERVREVLQPLIVEIKREIEAVEAERRTHSDR